MIGLPWRSINTSGSWRVLEICKSVVGFYDLGYIRCSPFLVGSFIALIVGHFCFGRDGVWGLWLCIRENMAI
jgi:hypothetical protein